MAPKLRPSECWPPATPETSNFPSQHGRTDPAAALERLFQPFYRSAVVHDREGLGLGLYIAHEIAIAHGGTLGVKSTQEETRFTFRMPAVSDRLSGCRLLDSRRKCRVGPAITVYNPSRQQLRGGRLFVYVRSDPYALARRSRASSAISPPTRRLGLGARPRSRQHLLRR